MVMREITLMIGDPLCPHVIVQANHDGAAVMIFGPFDSEDSAKACMTDVRSVADDIGQFAWSVVPLVSVIVSETNDEPYVPHAFKCQHHNTTHEIAVQRSELEQMVDLLASARPQSDAQCPSALLAEMRK